MTYDEWLYRINYEAGLSLLTWNRNSNAIISSPVNLFIYFMTNNINTFAFAVALGK